jgi:hypothetical protein
MREIECTRCFIKDVAWLCVCTSWAVQRRGMNVRIVVVVSESSSALGDRRVCVEGV